MTTSRRYLWPSISIVIALFFIIVALPNSAKQWAPGFLSAPSLHFGLDLAGGTQLDFRISERELNEQIADTKIRIEAADGEDRDRLNAELAALENQRTNLVEAIRTVLERRINALGVSEARITPSEFGGEKHLLVECPGVVDVQQCIQTVGKTIQLEFKEENTDPTAEYEAEINAMATEAYERVGTGEELPLIAQDLTSEIAVFYVDQASIFKDQLAPGLEGLWEADLHTPQRVDGSVIQPYQNAEGAIETQEIPGIYIAEVLTEKTTTGRTIYDPFNAMRQAADTNDQLTFTEFTDTVVAEQPAEVVAALNADTTGKYTEVTLTDGSEVLVYNRQFIAGQETMTARQMLISHAEAFATGASNDRTKEAALELATSVQQRAVAGENFAALAREFSDGPAAESGGLQDAFTRSQKDDVYAQAAFALATNEVSTVIETAFGYYIIQSVTPPQSQPDIVTFAQLQFTGDDTVILATIKTKLENNEVTKPEEQIAIRYLFFSTLPTGWQDTSLDGKRFRSAAVTLDEFSRPVVQINFDDEGARLFQQLTKENIGKRIAIFVGGELVSAPTVNAEIAGGTAIITGSSNLQEAQLLAQDLNTGAIPAPIYLSGQRTVEATLGATALQTSLKAALLGIAILMVYMVLVYRLLGLLADVALAGYALIFFAFLKLPLFLVSDQYIVLTLAGMAGIILSIGMAVDANVLIFERMKEELRKGKLLKTAAATGFDRAWPSIRDGNVSTFITCAILFIIGTSIIRGFAITLGLGVAISMFSAIVVTRFLIRVLATSPLSERPELLGVKKKSE